MSDVDQIKSDIYIERKKETREIFEWIETKFLLINIMMGKNHRVVYVDGKYWDRVSYYIDFQPVIELRIYHYVENWPRLNQWNYYLDTYDRGMINKCKNANIECINTYVDTIHDLYRILEAAFK